MLRTSSSQSGRGGCTCRPAECCCPSEGPVSVTLGTDVLFFAAVAGGVYVTCVRSINSPCWWLGSTLLVGGVLHYVRNYLVTYPRNITHIFY